MPMVVDASVAMAWCFEDEATPETEAILDRLAGDHAVVPTLWQLEVANVLLSAVRRRRMTEVQADRFRSLLHRLPITVDMTPPSSSDLFAAGARHGLTAYDACYLTLASRLGIPLATLDADLARACQVVGVDLLI